MLAALRSRPVASSSMSYYDSNTDRSHQTHTSSLVPPTILPKYFNVPFAIQNGYFRCVRYLLELSYDPNERDSQLRTPLILCSYIENDRWSLSLAQNLLEKGAKIALGDHVRRNAMHHACALQRIHLVQLYLSCLDFNIEAKDGEGNTCLHYVAITGNCEIAELLIKSAEKMNVHLDQYLNRDGCSAAILALKYGHIECANQITHRDWDEFFVVPRPLSIYETPPTTDDNQAFTTTTTSAAASKKRNKTTSHHSPPIKTDIRPSAFSFGLLKIIFNESDSTYSTRLAGFCNENKQVPHRRRLKHKKPHTSITTINKLDQTNSSIVNSTDCYSTEAIVNELQTTTIDDQRKTSLESNSIDRTSPRIELLMQQNRLNKTYLSTEDILHSNERLEPKAHEEINNDEIQSKTNIPTIHQQASNSTFEHYVSVLYEPPSTKKKTQRPKTAGVRYQTPVSPDVVPRRVSSSKIQPTQIPSKKKPLVVHRANSASLIPKQQHANLTSETSTYSQTLFAGRPLSAMVQNHYYHPAVAKKSDSSCSIREAKGVTSRYNEPEKLFGLKPEELFGLTEEKPKIMNSRKANENTRLKRTNLQKQQHIWRQDVDKIVDLYNIHHSSNYRSSAVPPSPEVIVPSDTLTDLTQVGKGRRMSLTKYSSNTLRSHTSIPKQSTLASLNIPRRNSGFRRPSIKLTNT